MESVTAFAPATVSNVACGFDVLGFALNAPGDEVTARFAPGGVRIDEITGDQGRLPRDAAKNTAGVAAQALLTILGERRGIALTIRKGLPLSSGLGGSAASAVAAVVAVDGLLGAHTPLETLMASAFEGERVDRHDRRDGAGRAAAEAARQRQAFVDRERHAAPLAERRQQRLRSDAGGVPRPVARQTPIVSGDVVDAHARAREARAHFVPR